MEATALPHWVEVLPFYCIAVGAGVGAASGVKRGLSHFPISEGFRSGVISAVIWVAFLFYLFQMSSFVAGAPSLERGDVELWFMCVGLPWLICWLGFPLFVSRAWLALLTALRDSAVQWLLTVLAAILSYAAFSIAQAVADFFIQALIQTHPNQLPSAQRALTAVGAIFIWVFLFYIAVMIVLFWVPVAEMRVTKRPIFGLTAALPILAAIFFVPLSTAIAFREAGAGDAEVVQAPRPSLDEGLVIWTSFIPNQLVEGAAHDDNGNMVIRTRLVCDNLPDNVRVAFVHPDEPVPNKVIIAEPRTGDIRGGAPAFNYRLARCENSNNPDGIE